MSQPTQIQYTWRSWDWHFPLPTAAQQRVDIDHNDFKFLMLAAVNAIAASVGEAPATPVTRRIAAEELGQHLAAAQTRARIVRVVNNSEFDVIVDDGGTPGFEGQSGYLGVLADPYPGDIGIILGPGDIFVTDRPTPGIVWGRTRDGDGSVPLVVTEY